MSFDLVGGSAPGCGLRGKVVLEEHRVGLSDFGLVGDDGARVHRAFVGEESVAAGLDVPRVEPVVEDDPLQGLLRRRLVRAALIHHVYNEHKI